jgi:hypothetical protein
MADKTEYLEKEKIKNMTINLSGENTFYLKGNDEFSIDDIWEWLNYCYDYPDYQLDEPSELSFIDWLEKFKNGTLNENEIEIICYYLHFMHECGSLFTHIKISMENQLNIRIEEVKIELKECANEYYKDITDEQIDKEALYHFYFKIGEYYIFVMCLDSPFETFKYLEKNKKT